MIGHVQSVEFQRTSLYLHNSESRCRKPGGLLTPCFFRGDKGLNMAKYNNQKAKILFLQQMLYETGENHTISMQMILDNLQKRGIRAERKSIYDDMDVLRYFGMDIRYRRERPSGYYLEKLTEAAEKMPEPVYTPHAEPDENEAVLENEAVPDDEVIPDNEAVQETEAAGEDNAIAEAESGSEYYKDQAPDFTSWMKPESSSRKKQMKLQCTDSGHGLARSYFGDSAEYRKREDGYYIITAPLQETSGFFGWVTASGGNIRIIKPKKTAQAYREYLKGIIKDYKGL